VTKINAVILTRARTVKRVAIPLEEYALYEENLYNLTPANVATKIDGAKGAKNPEVVLFEGAPSPIGSPDHSKQIAETVVAVNLIENVTEKAKTKKINRGLILVVLAVILIAGAIYGLYSTGYLDAWLR